MLDRRTLLSALAVGALADGRAAAAVDREGFLRPGPLGDAWIGREDAPHTIVEYASMTCSHCAAFHRSVWPSVKERLVDTGKARFALREFPLDPLATAGFMLARAREGAYYPVTDMLFEAQADWAFVRKPLDALEGMMRRAGVAKPEFEATIKDQRLYDGVNAVKRRAAEAYGVGSTPTFFVDGVLHRGDVTADAFEAALLAKAP